MTTCPSCRYSLSDADAACPHCGWPADANPDDAPTGYRPAPAPAAAARDDGAAAIRPQSPAGAGYFGSVAGAGLAAASEPRAGVEPGSMLAGRYRIVALLGRGGMGDVYRADDLTLGQPVALKFLPPALEHDPVRLERFLDEVRTARQVSHPNVCRVYDIGEADGRHYLSMEYIDGEDLASLLRRIGRLPSDKALEMARQLCAGLAAAHDKGVLHRDLKPANVMLDGRGKVRLTDFGLAQVASAASSRSAEIAGTPAYMAPEQFTGAPATVQSDLYALGLVLYEIFSGRRAFDASLISDLRRLHEESHPPSLSTVVRDVEPAVERVIFRCLEKDPRSRPASAIAVAAALPGGDPLAAALAAGETPSPAMVAAAGEAGGLRPVTAWLLLIVAIVGLVATAAVATRVNAISRVPLPYSPEVLSVKAREMLGRLGYTTPPADTAAGFSWDGRLAGFYAAHPGITKVADPLGTGHVLLEFWYRESAGPLVPQHFSPDAVDRGDVTTDDPPIASPGMTLVGLDPLGRLLRFRTVLPEADQAASADTPRIDWHIALAETGIDKDGLAPATPSWLPSTWADERAAWTGRYRDLPDIPIRIEAAAYRGRLVFLEVARPWSEPRGVEKASGGAADRVEGVIRGIVLAFCLAGGLFVARNNVRMGRGDRRGAARLALVITTTFLASWVVAGHHVLGRAEVSLFFSTLAFSLLGGAAAWTFYMAIEPHVRRRWPHTLISWSRLLAGQVSDPLVGRDVLIGAAAGSVLALIAYAGSVVRMALLGRQTPSLTLLVPLLGPGHAVGSFVHYAFNAVISVLTLFFGLFVLRLVLRRDLFAGAVFVLLSVAQNALGNNLPMLTVSVAATAATCLVVLLFRSGILAFGVAQFILVVVAQFPLTIDVGTWVGSSSGLTLLLLSALAVYGFRVSLAGRPRAAASPSVGWGAD